MADDPIAAQKAAEAAKPKTELEKAKDLLVKAEYEAIKEAEVLMRDFVAGMEKLKTKLPPGGIPTHIASFVEKMAGNADSALKGELMAIKAHYMNLGLE